MHPTPSTMDIHVGSVLNRSFSIWLKNLIPFTILACLVYAPLIAYTAIMVSGELTVSKINVWGIVVTAGGLALDLIASAAMVYGVFQQLRGQHAGMGECLSVGLKRLLPVLGVGLLTALCVCLGLVALIIPGIIISLMLYVAVPAAVVEGTGVVDSLKRSKALTQDYKGVIFGVLFVVGIIERASNWIIEKVLLGEAASIADVKLYLCVIMGIAVLLGSLGAVISAVVYHDLRATKEGVDVHELVRVFE